MGKVEPIRASPKIVIRKTTLFWACCCITWFCISTGLAIGLGVPLSLSLSKTKCPLVYDGSKGVITENMMERWANSVGWPLTHPTLGEHGCRCPLSTTPNDQGFFESNSDAPFLSAWIAPVDLYALFPNGNFPRDFPSTAKGAEDHIKACLSPNVLTKLYYDPDTGTSHCHDLFGKLYTGYDGDPYCTPSAGSSCTTAQCYGQDSITCSSQGFYGSSGGNATCYCLCSSDDGNPQCDWQVANAPSDKCVAVE